jgi:hypothetical protein
MALASILTACGARPRGAVPSDRRIALITTVHTNTCETAGLSAFKETTSAAGESLQPLLDYAYEHIPEDRRKTAPAYLMATAGLRLVGEENKDQILKSVCDKLAAAPFVFQCAWATLLSGFDEGLYGWVTVNYLMKALSTPKSTTYGTIDLGGGSVQIAFEPDAKASLPAPYLAAVPLPGGEKRVYVKSHLGYGLDEARRSIAAVVAKEGRMLHPCLPSGMRARAARVLRACPAVWALIPVPSLVVATCARAQATLAGSRRRAVARSR